MAYQFLEILLESCAPSTLALVSLGIALSDTSRVPMLEAAVCERWYQQHDPSAIGTDGWVPEQLCKELPVQAPVALISGGDLQFGALSGRFTTWNVKMVWFAHAFDIVGGGPSMTYIMLWALIAEATNDEQRSSVFFAMDALLLLVQASGIGIGGSLLRTSPWTLTPIAVLSHLLTAPIILGSLLRFPSRMRTSIESLRPGSIRNGDAQSYSPLPQRPPSGQSSLQSSQTLSAGESLVLSSSESMARVAKAFLNLIYQQFFQHRVFQLSFAMLALIVTAMNLEYLHQQWASNAFSWTLAESTYMLAYVSFVSFVVLTGLSQVNKLLLPRFRNAQAMDFYVTWCSLLLRALASFALGLSQSPYSFIASLTLYTLSIGLYESVRALLTSFAPLERTTELYTLIMMIDNLGNMAGSQLWPRIFTAVLAMGGVWRGLPFLLSAVCYMAAFGLLTCLPQYLGKDEDRPHS